MTTSVDTSENRRNSFAPAEARVLTQIAGTLEMTVRLSPEDPRLADLESNVLVKLRRAMRVEVHYPLEGRTGLFDEDVRYGTIEYRLGDRRAVNRSTTEAIVIGTICELAGVPAPPAGEPEYPGHPLRAQARGAEWIFYVVWPAITLLVALRSRRTG